MPHRISPDFCVRRQVPAFNRGNHLMHELYNKANDLAGVVIAAAVEVQKHFGIGIMESVYVKCLARELALRGHATKAEVPVSIQYKGFAFQERLRVDLLVDDCLVVEAKAIDVKEADMPLYRAQTLSYLRLLNLPLGLVINFHEQRLGARGVARVILKGAADA